MDHIYAYSPTLEPKPQPSKLKPYLGLFLLTFGIVLSLSAGFIRWQRAQSKIEVASHQPDDNSTALAPLLNEESLGSPLQAKVAGASDQNIATTNTNFAVVGDEQVDMPPTDCSPEVFLIGEPEMSPLDNPVDEFNWVGALDVLPTAVDPFIVGQHQTKDFAWRTSSNSEGSSVNQIQFEYLGPVTTGQLTISWSPGNSGSASKLVYLDESLVGATETYQGQFVSDAWQNMPIVRDTMKVNLLPGVHTFTIKSVNYGGDPSVWDYIQLTAACP